MRSTTQHETPPSAPRFPALRSMPTGDADFLPEVHRARITRQMTTIFGEPIAPKPGHTQDARQKRQ
jgi:hypothetical protein